MPALALTLVCALLSSEPPAGPLKLEMEAAAPARPGGPVELRLTAINTSGSPVELHFNSSQRYDFEIHSADGLSVWTWSAERSFLQVLGRETIPAGGRLEYADRFTGTLPAGAYRATGRITAREPTPPASTPLTMP